MGYTIGVDIGGTFSDCVVLDESGRVFHGKAQSTHSSSPVEGMFRGLEDLAGQTGDTLRSLLGATTEFCHGTTIGTNLIVERNGARVGLIATRGHGDALLMMRGRGRTAGAPPDRILNVRDTDKPEPLVPRERVVEITERVSVDGSVLVALDEEDVRAAVERLLAEDVEAIAVALLWSFRHPAHEQRVREIARELAPGTYVSISSDIAPRQGEFERTVATVINAYIGPASSRYLDRLAGELRASGLGPSAFIMQANGGVMPVAAAGERPVQTIGSGPAGGLAGTRKVAALAGHRNVIATDMGGTSFEVGLIVDGEPILASESVIEQYTFKVSHLDVRSIACGGGSIARIDPRSGGLIVGPESAGSDPGPACYGRGTEATVTDADVVLGLIDPERFLGGEMALDTEASVRAVQQLAVAGGLSLEQAAAGILQVNGNNAATLIRQRTVQQGLDPREFALYAFGGAGPVHAFAFARDLGVREVLIPLGNGASTLSAYGIAASDVMQVFEHECRFPAPFDTAALGATIESVQAQAVADLEAAGFHRTAVRVSVSALARYVGQWMQELVLAVPETDAGVKEGALEERFRTEYTRLYGAAAMSPFHQPEIFTIRVAAVVGLGGSETDPHEMQAGAHRRVEAERTREVYWPGDGRWTTTAVFDTSPEAGEAMHGPAVVQLRHTTISVAAGQWLRTDGIGNCTLSEEANQ